MPNVKKVTGFSRVSTHIPAQAALLLIDRAVEADRSVSAYVAEILMHALHSPPRSFPRLLGGRGPRSDADPAGTAKRVLRAAKARQAERARQVATQRTNAARAVR